MHILLTNDDDNSVYVDGGYEVFSEDDISTSVFVAGGNGMRGLSGGSRIDLSCGRTYGSRAHDHVQLFPSLSGRTIDRSGCETD